MPPPGTAHSPAKAPFRTSGSQSAERTLPEWATRQNAAAAWQGFKKSEQFFRGINDREQIGNGNWCHRIMQSDGRYGAHQIIAMPPLMWSVCPVT